jgi:hypothetical protein
MPKPIIGANNRATKIDIVLPVDASGDYAFDENGDPVKGRTPVSFTIPRWDCMTREQVKALNKAVAEINELIGDDGEPLDRQDRDLELVLAMVRPFISEEDVAVVKGLRLFELEQIAERIKEGSTITVGELLASTSS